SSSADWLRENLDLLEERRATAHLRTLEYKKVVASQEIKVGNLVLRKAEVSDPTRSRGKLALYWEGPY
ncbi:hypothetical protein GW17_00058203, partial [Ensete ventricosum]